MHEGQRSEQGFALLAMLALILPLLVVVGAVCSTFDGQSKALQAEIQQEQALLAAESGLDEALYRAKLGTLVSNQSFTRVLDKGLSFKVTPKLLKNDGVDNDGDGSTDEPDENVFQLIIDGYSNRAHRRLAGFLGQLPTVPSVNAAVQFSGTGTEIELKGTPTISGVNKNMNGTAGSGGDLPGMVISTPGTTAAITGQLSATEKPRVTGNSPAPSVNTATPWDLTNFVNQVKNSANLVLTSDHYTNANLGNGPAGVANIVYRQGKLELKGNTRGAGILVVTGELEIEGNVRWDGIIIVLGEECELENGSTIFGSVILGPSVHEFETESGTTKVQYSREAIDLASNLLPGKYVTFNGWQEITTQ